MILEKPSILQGLVWAVYGAWADDDEKPVVVTCEDARSLEAGGSDGAAGFGGRGDFVAQQGGLDERIILASEKDEEMEAG